MRCAKHKIRQSKGSGEASRNALRRRGREPTHKRSRVKDPSRYFLSLATMHARLCIPVDDTTYRLLRNISIRTVGTSNSI